MRLFTARLVCVAAGTLGLIFGTARAMAAPVGHVVTFETLTDATTQPTDNAVLATTDAYELTNGVALKFVFRDEETLQFNAAGRFEHRGVDPTRGYISPSGTGNEDTGRTAALNAQLGLFFLRSPVGQLNAGDVGLKIEYSNNVGMRYAAGEIWDIDSVDAMDTEQWRIDAYSSSNALLDTVTSPLGVTDNSPGWLDAMPWTFELVTRQDIAYVLIEFIGGKTEGVGLAFNNFRTTPTLPADFDANLRVEGADLALWRGAWGPSGVGDADEDGQTDGDDFLLWQQELGLTVAPPAGTSVPEPEIATLLLATCGLSWGLARRRFVG